jgi:hypothetical protein
MPGPVFKDELPLGLKIISELGRRGQRGMYFNYLGYRKLRGISTLRELRNLLNAYHFEVVPESDDPRYVVDGIEILEQEKGRQAKWVTVLLDPCCWWSSFRFGLSWSCIGSNGTR